MGKLCNYEAHLQIDEKVVPVIQPVRRIPFAMRDKVEKELQRLQSLDIIEDVEGPTAWMSPIVCVPKANNPDAVRLCIDMRLPNTAIMRERHPSPTLEDLIAKLNGASHFSKLDLSCAYHQLSLSPDCRYITTFITHKGLKRFKRLTFGANSASEIFQHAMQSTFHGIEGCQNISDDLIIDGKNKQDHDRALRAVLQRAYEKNFRFGFKKCEFDKQHLNFFGHVFSESGISPCPSKVSTIKSPPPPTNVHQLRSFLGMIQYCQRFIDLAMIWEPLRNLTKKQTTWKWTKVEQTAFDQLKGLLTSDTTMAYFDPEKNTEVYTDASDVGLGSHNLST